MDAPAEPPNPQNLGLWKGRALEYLQGQLKDVAPIKLGEPTLFPISPLAGEGATVVFPFAASRGPPQATRRGEPLGEEFFFVVVGITEPNYYPAYGLEPEEVFSLHLGTRFMLVMGVAQCPPPETYDPRTDARAIVDRVAPDAPLDGVEVAACFDVEGSRHIVLRCRLRGEAVYIFGGDAPHGFSRRVDLPPQVAYRVHIGHVLRVEANPGHERG